LMCLALALALAALADLRWKFLSWRCARCTARSVQNRCWSSVRAPLVRLLELG
jgi:hypothetical protein